jgi:hypothetical protein
MLAGGVGGASARGRPQRDLADTSNKTVEELRSQAEGDQLWFGEGFKTQLKYTLRLEKDVSSKMETSSAHVHDHLLPLRKQLRCINLIMKAVHELGQASEPFMKLWGEQHVFLNMDPVAPSPFPPFLHRQHCLNAATYASSSYIFWKVPCILQTLMQPPKANVVCHATGELAKRRRVVPSIRLAQTLLGNFGATMWELWGHVWGHFGVTLGSLWGHCWIPLGYCL